MNRSRRRQEAGTLSTRAVQISGRQRIPSTGVLQAIPVRNLHASVFDQPASFRRRLLGLTLARIFL